MPIPYYPYVIHYDNTRKRKIEEDEIQIIGEEMKCYYCEKDACVIIKLDVSIRNMTKSVYIGVCTKHSDKKSLNNLYIGV